MDNMIFSSLMVRIKNDPNSIAQSWYDGTKWTDQQGNWYGWTDRGYIEYVFYAGTKWERRTDYKGNKTIKEV